MNLTKKTFSLSGWLPLFVTEGVIQASKGDNQATTLPIDNTYEPQQGSAWHDNTKGIVVAHIPWQ